MRTFDKPKIVISKCLGHVNCRYDGTMINSDLVDSLSPYVEYISVCPEMGIGLPVPREALRLVRNERQEDRLVFSQTGTDRTDDMINFSKTFLETLDEKDIDGFILKHRSPSCGTNDVKVYKGTGKSSSLPARTTGLFGRSVELMFPHVPLENEGRLLNYNIREHFMMRIFMLRDFKKVKSSGKMSALIKFHSDNKYLLMAFSPKYLGSLGKAAANHEGHSFSEVAAEYEDLLVKALEQPLSISRNVNVLLHVFGYFKNYLSSDEKAFFLENLELYNEKRVPLSVLLGILKSWVVRFDVPYLKGQTLFEPFPAKLFAVTDSGKGL